MGSQESKTYLPDQQSPNLLVLPYVWYNLDMKEIFGVCDTDKYRRTNKAKEEELRDRCCGEAGGDHVDR